MTADDLAYMSAATALERFASRELSPGDVLQSVTQRIMSENSAINAFGDMFLDEAATSIRKAERRWADGTAGPLEGILVAVKDAQGVAGQRTTFGSPSLKDNIISTDDPIIERLRAAGAVFHARTTVSEFCVSGVCVSPMWGVTRNPWNLGFSPGGSSGGSAAALAAGMTTLATGTDMGGSIRVPASACGVVGYKPPHGRNPDASPLNLDRTNACGPLARSVADLALFQNVVAGRHGSDPDSLPHPPVLPTTVTRDLRGIRVGWSIDLSYRRVAGEVAANTMKAIETMRDLGCVCEHVELGWTGEIEEAAASWFAAFGTSGMLLDAVSRDPANVSADLRKLSDHIRGMRGNAHALLQVFRVISVMNENFERAMRGFDVFVCPTMAVAAVKADQNMWATDFHIEGENVDPEFGYSMTHQFNLLGTCPVISIPSGHTAEGLPTGIQIVGKPFDELPVFDLALAFEAAAGPFPMPNQTWTESAPRNHTPTQLSAGPAAVSPSRRPPPPPDRNPRHLVPQCRE